MNKKQKKEPFSLKNMNGLSHDDARTCALDDMNCLNGQEEHRSSLQDMNAARSRPHRKYHLTDMNGEDGREGSNAPVVGADAHIGPAERTAF